MFCMFCVCLLSIALSAFVIADVNKNTPSDVLNEFSLKLLSEASDELSNSPNVILSPYTVWIALSILHEGAGEKTARELEDVLGIPSNDLDKESFRIFQQHIIKNIVQNSNGITLDVANDIFARREASLNAKYQDLVQRIYNTKIESLDFNDKAGTAQFINEKISNVTRGRISEIISPGDIGDGVILYITSALFFKGLWENPFEKIDTKMQFYDDEGRFANDVTMMQNTESYNYGTILDGKAEVVELPYKGKRLSMILVVPKDESLPSILRSITELSFRKIMDSLGSYGDVEVVMPKFNISTSVELKQVLQKMGIRDVFLSTANLKGISTDNLLVSSVTHDGKIEVDEEGTVAAGVTKIGIVLTSLSFHQTIRVVLNKPFSYFIYDKQTESILFLGRVTNPNSV